MGAERRVRARTGCRVDLAGGTLDIWPLGLLHAGARTVNVAVEVPVEIGLRRIDSGYRVELDDGTVVEAASTGALIEDPRTDLVGWILEERHAPATEVKLSSASPRGGGLGGSSAIAVALIAALDTLDGRASLPVESIASVARDLEARLMSLPTGRQDHYPPLLGGALEILYRAGGEEVRSLDCDLETLGRSLVVAYTGRSHFSAASNWGVVRRRLDGDAESIRLFDGICEAAREAAAALEAGDLPRLGAAMASEWSFRRRLAEGVDTPEIASLLARSAQAGAWGGKATGAGGGGCIAVLTPPAARGAVEEALSAGGATVLEAPPRASALEISLLD